ncbi:hypothetical protein [Sphingobacterium sp. JB170]|uniref:hypothetical protein n=1 Tax=Sphingobacterium sp. JB170 TaxID=1434842 RepID=UPI00097EDF85|nr:hypothetical protein [Sphingobacterium sp. JB170]SJN21343.1 hypothetical protein FM107_02785 [Sphingobacterium sp. JB170]
MRNLQNETTQAFYFSLGFYILSFVLKFLQVSFADVVVSIALLLSLLWVVLVLREVMISTRISNVQRLALLIFIILGNILAGIVYFSFLRRYVLGTSIKQ